MSDITPTNEAERSSFPEPGQNVLLSRHDGPMPKNRGIATARPIVVVLGMHRSGTSLLSNVLHMLGVDMADTSDHVSPKNPGGFWERPELTAIHDEILEAIDRPIALPSHVLPFPPAWWRSKKVQAVKPKLIDYLQRELGKSINPWGFKDPRTCRLLPLWWEIFRELNLEPVYVVATRSPAESSVSMSQKSSARTLSIANGELMWLSYNYDIARHVMLKDPVIAVDYGEWFEGAVAVGERLARQFGIGEHLSPDELAECMLAIVHPEYRHEFAESPRDRSIAMMFYEALKEAASGDDAGLRALRGQVRLVDMFFKSIAPIVHDLDAAASERASLISERDRQLEHLSLTHEESAKRTAELERTKSELAEAKRAAEEQLHEAAALSARFNDAKAASENIRRELDEVRAAAANAKAASESIRNELQEVRAAAAAAQQALASESAAIQRKLDEQLAEVERAKKAEREALEAAAEWRGAYAAEHGEPAARIEAGAAAAELQRKLNSAERRLRAAEERQRAFIAALEERDIASASMHNQASSVGEKPERVFTWPSDGVSLDVAGQVDRVDAAGIVGGVTVRGRPDIVPIVEVRVGQTLVVAQNCVPDESRTGEDGHWRFSISWSRFASEHAATEAVLLVAGVECEVGRASVPADLIAFQQSPAVRAAAVFGGSVAEAAEYHQWLRESEAKGDVELARNYCASRRATWPTITIVLYGGNSDGLPFTIQSLQQQVYSQWEAWCIDAPTDVPRDDPRIRTASASEFADVLADSSTDALFSFVEIGDLISPTALLHLAEAAARQPDFSLIYSDEDVIERESGIRALPYMKPEWSPDLALSQDYLSRLALVRSDKLKGTVPENVTAVHRIALEAALSGSGQVVHVPFVLYHRAGQNSQDSPRLAQTTQSVLDSLPGYQGAKVVTDEDGRTKVRWPIPDPLPLVSLIVPTRDRVDLLRNCVDGFLHDTNYKNLEVLIADNDSQEEATKTYMAKVATHPRVRVIPCPGPFNFSAINNRAAEEARGELIGLMNNDLKVFDPEWLRVMVSNAIRADVGIVGAKLLYEDGAIQHAGVTLGLGIPSHLYKAAPLEAEGRNGRLVLPHDVSAVTAACLVMRREIWSAVGGLDEEFPVAYNDIDLCLKVRAAGYRVLWTPDAVLYHLESRSRGKDGPGEKRERLNRDKARLAERWGDMLTNDPFHSPNFSATHVDSRLSFPPRTAASWRPGIKAA